MEFVDFISHSTFPIQHLSLRSLSLLIITGYLFRVQYSKTHYSFYIINFSLSKCFESIDRFFPLFILHSSLSKLFLLKEYKRQLSKFQNQWLNVMHF